MTPEELVKLLTELGDGLKADMAEHCKKMDAKYDAVMDSLKKRDAKKDEAGERDRGIDGTMAERVAADRSRSDSVGAAEFSVLCRAVSDLQKKVATPHTNLDQLADVQAKADAVMRTHNESASPPMAGEDIVSYKIRQHRPMQKFSPRWKNVELRAIAGDSTALEIALEGIRADAYQAGINPVDLPEFQHRMITETLPGGHTSRRFIGNGTFIKQMSRPVRHVAFIGVRTPAAHP